VVIPLAVGAQEGGFEPPPTLRAAEVLPDNLLDMNTYRIDSDFGQFQAYGTTMLQFRLQEIEALAELDELSKTQVFADALKNSATAQVDAVKQFADRPVETVKGVPGGVKRLVKRTKRTVEEGVDDVQEYREERAEKKAAGDGDGDGEDDSTVAEDAKELGAKGVEAGGKYAKKYFGVTGAERRWAQKLGIDPYTDNEVLMREIKEVARVDAAGSLTVRLAPIPRIPGVNYLADATQLVWTKHPSELRALNLEKLVAMGASPELAESLLDNPALSPTLQTLLVSGLDSLAGVGGREIVIEQAAAVDSREGGLFFVQAISMLSGFHRSSSPVSRLLGGASLPGALTGDSRLVFLLPVDYVFWTEDIAAAARGPFGQVGGDLELKGRELWLRGQVSDRCRQELMDDGWRVLDEIRFSSASGVGP
jgi:hypothetical protein